MNSINLKTTAIACLVLITTTLFANIKPNYPKGFIPKTNAGVVFTENKGQVHDQHYKSRLDVLFSGTDGHLTFHLKNNGISYQLFRVDTWKKESDLVNLHADLKIPADEKKLVADQTTIYRLDINWVNSNINTVVKKQDPLDGFNNYYLENCDGGALNVKSYHQIMIQNIYDGIDLKWYEKDGKLKYDYLVSAGVDYKKIELKINGADKIFLNKKGDVIFKTPLGDIIEQAPIVKQNGKFLKSKWVIKNNILSFDIQGLDDDQPYIIDPAVRTWGTYYGGLGYDAMADFNVGNCSTDASGNVYLCGYTSTSSGISIATSGGHQSTFSGGLNDAYLVKFNALGVRQWGTYYGGSGDELAFSSSVDPFGNIYMVGHTSSNVGTVIATLGSHQSFISGSQDAFLVKFNSFGVRQWGTYYGDIGGENGFSCSFDASGNVYMAGMSGGGSLGTAIATIGSHQLSNYGGANAYLVKFNSSGVRQWGTFYGGDSFDTGTSCSVDVSGNVYLAGVTTCTNIGAVIATPGSHQTIFGGGNDAFLVKFNSSGVRQWGTFYGGYSTDGVGILSYLVSCKTDNSNNIYLFSSTSTSTGTAISSLGSHQPNFGGGSSDAYLVKFNSLGVRQWGTYYGDSGNEFGFSCTTNSTGDVFITGTTTSTASINSIATAGSHQTLHNGGGYDAYLVKFNTSGIRQWGTFYGGNGLDSGNSCATDGSGNVYMNGYTDLASGTGIATPGSHQPTYGGAGDAYLVKFIDCPTSTITVSNGSICIGKSYTISPIGSSTYTFASNTSTISGVNAIVSPTATTNYTISGMSAIGCLSTSNAVITVSVNASPVVAVNSGSICSGKSFTMIPSGANTYTYSSGTNIVSPLTTSNYSVTGTSALGCVGSNTAISTVVVNSSPVIAVNSGSICSGKSFTMTPSGASSYTYSSGTNIVNPLTTVNYSVTGTSALGCVGSNTAISTVVVNTLPIIAVNSGTICSGKSFTMIPSGASTYTYSSGTSIVSPLTTSNYSVTGTSALGCVGSNTAISNVLVNASPVIAVNSGSICSGKSFTMTPSGASTYTYSSGSNVVSPLTTINYSVTGTSALGCVGSNTAISNVVVNASPVIAVNSGSICSGQSFTITPSGATTYTYSSGTNIVSPLTTSNYSVTGTSALGCAGSNTAISAVVVNASPIIAVNSGSICSGKSFTIIPTGALSYSYSGGSAVKSPTTNTTYTVIGASAAGCTNTAVSSVTVIAKPTLIVSTSNSLICLGNSAVLSASTSATTYTWNTGATTMSVSVSPTLTSTYTVNVSNAAACVSTATIMVTVNTCTGIDEVFSNSNSIYPNPNNGEFTLELNETTQVIITNILGSVLLNSTLNTGKQTLDFKNHANGIYFVHLIIDGKRQTIKLIKE